MSKTPLEKYFVEDAIKNGLKNVHGTVLMLPMKQEIMVQAKKRMEEGKLHPLRLGPHKRVQRRTICQLHSLHVCARLSHERAADLEQKNEWAGWVQWMRKAFRHGKLPV